MATDEEEPQGPGGAVQSGGCTAGVVRGQADPVGPRGRFRGQAAAVDDLIIDLDTAEPAPIEQVRLLKAVREFDAYLRANAGRFLNYRDPTWLTIMNFRPA